MVFLRVHQDWLEYKKQNIRDTTRQMYEMLVRLHLSDFNEIRINRATMVKVERLVSKLQGLNMNLSTLRKVIITLNQIMNYAVRHRYVEFNPVNQEAACRLENVIFEKSGSKMNFAKKKESANIC